MDDCEKQQQQRQRHTRPSPGLWDLLVRDGRPHRLAVPLLFEFTTKSLLYVVHVEGTDGRTGDAGERKKRARMEVRKIPCSGKNMIYLFCDTSAYICYVVNNVGLQRTFSWN